MFKIKLLKNRLLVSGVVAVIAATSISIFVYNEYFKDNNINKNVKITEPKEDDLMKYNVIDNPMVYDYMRGMLGRNYDVNINQYGNCYLLLVDKNDLSKNKGYFYESMSSPVDMFPSLNSDPLKYEIKGERWIGIAESFKNWPKNLTMSNKNYNIYIVQEGEGNQHYQGSNWQGFDFKDSGKRIGMYAKESENGFDINWLRKEPWKTEIMSNFKIDISNKFYDKYKYNEIIRVQHKNDPNNIIRIKVVGVDKFRVLDGMVMDYSLEELNTQLNYDGYKTVEKR